MQHVPNSNLDYLEILPPSSAALKEEVESILNKSESYSAAIKSIDKKTGTYQIILQGRLPQAKIHSSIA